MDITQLVILFNVLLTLNILPLYHLHATMMQNAMVSAGMVTQKEVLSLELDALSNVWEQKTMLVGVKTMTFMSRLQKIITTSL